MLEMTGERIIPDLMKPTNGMLLEHLARYQFAIPYATGRVLDIACGTGYGIQMVTKAAKQQLTEAVGADIDDVSITYAKRRYHHPLISYTRADVLDRASLEPLGSFDTIMSFETIEHIQDDHIFMENIISLLKPGGTLIVSTPFGQGRGKPTLEPFHFHQLTKSEFKQLFSGFATVDYYVQKGVLIEPDPGRAFVHYPIGLAVCVK